MLVDRGLLSIRFGRRLHHHDLDVIRHGLERTKLRNEGRGLKDADHAVRYASKCMNTPTQMKSWTHSKGQITSSCWKTPCPTHSLGIVTPNAQSLCCTRVDWEIRRDFAEAERWLLKATVQIMPWRGIA